MFFENLRSIEVSIAWIAPLLIFQFDDLLPDVQSFTPFDWMVWHFNHLGWRTCASNHSTLANYCTTAAHSTISYMVNYSMTTAAASLVAHAVPKLVTHGRILRLSPTIGSPNVCWQLFILLLQLISYLPFTVYRSFMLMSKDLSVDRKNLTLWRSLTRDKLLNWEISCNRELI